MLPISPLTQAIVAQGSGPVDLTTWAYVYDILGVFPTTPSTTVTMAINRDGSMTVAGSAGTESGTEPAATDWYNPNGGTPGDGYEVRVTETSNTFDTGTVGSWVALSSNRTWTYVATNFIGSKTVAFTVEIRPTSGSVVSTISASITINGGFA